MLRFLLTLSFSIVASVLCRAEPFWIAWGGTNYPEENGWQRAVYGGGARRSLDDGGLVLDAGDVSGIIDEYSMSRAQDPGPAEVFSIEWRLCVDEAEYQDAVVAVSSYGKGVVDLALAREAVHSILEHIWIPVGAGLVHQYVLSSSDLITYVLAIDGQVVHTGQFVGLMCDSIVTWGDTFYGASSVSHWDYVRFGIVPEPSAVLVCRLAALTVRMGALATGVFE
jgi:hypothetical protein